MDVSRELVHFAVSTHRNKQCQARDFLVEVEKRERARERDGIDSAERKGWWLAISAAAAAGRGMCSAPAINQPAFDQVFFFT